VAYPAWDVLVIDQSDDDQVRIIVTQYAPRLPRMAYHHMTAKGASRARNCAIKHASGEVLAFVDDDCTVEPDWLTQVAGAFARHPGAAIVCGAVAATAHNPKDVLIPVTSIQVERVLQGPRRLSAAYTIMSASMYMQRHVVRQIGPFDLNLGPGAALFRNGEDTDYVCRTLLLGYQVLVTPAIQVRHHGARSFKDGAASQNIRATAHSRGGLVLKLLRCGHLAALRLLAKDLSYNFSRVEWDHILNRQGPTGLAWMAFYLRGLRDSTRLSVDQQHLLYRDPACRNTTNTET
jgi:GT2 family glycosyltransferase